MDQADLINQADFFNQTLTPGSMLDQYRRIKREHKDEVLFFRLGDFYEMFSEDAIEVSSLLNLTLTSRSGQPMCGIPYHASRTYISRLLKHGKKIAVCEQIADPSRVPGSKGQGTKGQGTKGPMDRRVVEIITPGTTVEEEYLDKGSSNYLCCLASFDSLYYKTVYFSFSYIDISTGDFFATCFNHDDKEKILQELERLDARELIIQESLLSEHPFLLNAIKSRPSIVLNRWADWLFDFDRGKKRLEKQFGTSNLKGFGLNDTSPEILSAAALLHYLDDTSRSLIPHIHTISVYDDSQFVGIDESSRRNLELTKNLKTGDNNFTLIEVMDETRTAMGKRLLKSRILQPLRDEKKIQLRLDNVDIFYHNQELLSRVRDYLGKTPDLERLSSRIAMDKAHGKDMAGTRNALMYFFLIEEQYQIKDIKFESAQAVSFDSDAQSNLKNLCELLQKSIPDDPSILLSEANLIKKGFNAELDQLHELKSNGRNLLEKYLEEERLNTGITSLKIRYNRLIGYYFEVTKNHLSKVPSHFIKRQGIVAGERFTTDKLIELESNINSSSDSIIELEKKLFLEIRDKAKALLSFLISASRRIAEIDTAQSLARAATIHGWVKPVIDNKNRFHITEGRHPVVEAHLPAAEFIPNDVILDENGISFMLITGPNMAGKSTYLRQTALIVIMAQAGSFVPAQEAFIGICDRIYCRVGASDNLAKGESTFLVEMNETAFILNSATSKSLVIMDEVGRGTGTKDGLSIAWAVSEQILNRIKCRTLFATHYQELTKITHNAMANRSLEILDDGDKIVFLHKLREGASAGSYGIHVARLAGLPESVLDRAGEIMEELSLTSSEIKISSDNSKKNEVKIKNSIIENKLLKLDINSLSPLQALNYLFNLKKQAMEQSKDKKHGSSKPESLIPDKFSKENPELFE